jgi:DNA-binding transcriptional MerR regulator
MKELAEASGVSAGTIKHYLREGLLPEPVKTSRNMAYYPAEFVDRIRLIKQLQEERFMPLKVIKAMLDDDPERARALVELEDRILERALAGEQSRVSAAELRRRYDVPQEVLDRLAELEVLTPNRRGYGPRDVEIVEAIQRFRAGGYASGSASPSTTPCATWRSSRRSNASAPAATTSGSASPSTTPCATSARSRSW